MRLSVPAMHLTAAVILTPVAPTAGAQTQQVQPQQNQPCPGPEHRQFDFWIGEWDVFNPQGQQVGSNRISRIYGGCALEERWQSSGAHAGASFNIYDVRSRKWHQTWIDNGGLLLQLDGEFVNGKMVLQGVTLQPDGSATVNRITWQEIDQGRVRQLWESSQDDGSTWSVVFDGTYVKR